MRAPAPPPMGAKTKMPLFARFTRRSGARCEGSAAGAGGGERGRRGDDRPAQGLAAVGRVNKRSGEHPAVEPVPRVRVVITYDLEPREGTDPRSDQHVARPVPVVVHARDTGERGTS